MILAGTLAGLLMVRQARMHASLPLEGSEEAFAAAPGAESSMIPDPTLTPGAVRRVVLNDVCSMAHEEVVRNVPDSLRQQVFEEYGIVNPRAQDYEIDYLIAPGLGGADDIHNLWPEPSRTSAWNAHVKDALEERLHQLVCDGQLDLPTAQQAIARDWIAAYKKYLGPGRNVAQARPRPYKHTSELVAKLEFAGYITR